MDIDNAYAIAANTPGADAFPGRWAADAQDYRARLAAAGRARLGLMYGHGPREVLDLFLPDGVPVGLAVFVHGGYWLRFDRESWSHFAEGARARGWAVAMPSYDLAPRVRISDITRQVATAIAVAAREVPGPVRLAGHSAGGHQVLRMAMPGVLPAAIAARLEKVLAISPVVDLRPLMQTAMNADLRIDEEEAARESPVLGHPLPVPVSVHVAADERPVFLDHAAALAKAWSAASTIVPHKHHFDIIDALCDPASGMVADWLD